MIDPKKQYRTRDGREVRIYAVDHREPVSVVGAVLSDGEWMSVSWFPTGECYKMCETLSDLIEVKPRIKREVWVNVYPGENTHWVMHLTKESADRQSMPNRIACVKLVIDCEEGEGLDNG